MQDICWLLSPLRPTLGISAAMFYTAAYAAMNLGAFAVVSHFANAGERYVTLEDYEGLGRSSPLLAATLTIFLLSLIGIPMTGGFFAKFYVFSAAVKANLIWLTIIGVINSGIGAYYYLRIIVVMYMRESRKEVPVSRVPIPLSVALRSVCCATIYLGIFPSDVLQFAQDSAQQLVQQSLTAPEHASPTPVSRCGNHFSCKCITCGNLEDFVFDKRSGLRHYGSTDFSSSGGKRSVELEGKMFKMISRLWFEDAGQDIAEYAVMLAVILVLVVGTIRLIGSNANNVFSKRPVRYSKVGGLAAKEASKNTEAGFTP